jgi:hypothetical protein
MSFVLKIKQLLVLRGGMVQGVPCTATISPFLIYCESPSEFQSFPIHPPELSGNYEQRYLLVKQELVEKLQLNFDYEVFNFIHLGFFNVP